MQTNTLLQSSDSLDIFTLTFEEKGLGGVVVKALNKRFKGNEFIEIPVRELVERQPIGYSNTVRRIALNSIVSEIDSSLEPLRPRTSQVAMMQGKLTDKNTYLTYEDLGIIVYGLSGQNSQIAQNLVRKATQRGIAINFPMMFDDLIPLTFSRYCPEFTLGKSDPYHVPMQPYRYISFPENNLRLAKTGFPPKDSTSLNVEYAPGPGRRMLTREFNGAMGVRRFGRDIHANCAKLLARPAVSYHGRINFIRK